MCLGPGRRAWGGWSLGRRGLSAATRMPAPPPANSHLCLPMRTRPWLPLPPPAQAKAGTTKVAKKAAGTAKKAAGTAKKSVLGSVFGSRG